MFNAGKIAFRDLEPARSEVRSIVLRLLDEAELRDERSDTHPTARVAARDDRRHAHAMWIGRVRPDWRDVVIIARGHFDDARESVNARDI